MTERTPAPGDQASAGERRAAQQAGDAAGGGGGRRDTPGGERRRGGPPIWLFVVAGALVVALVVVLVLVLGDRGGDQEPLPTRTTTLEPPTPTIEPMTREPGTAFYDALPSEVLQYALTESAPDETWFPDAALEGYRLVYSDGGGTDLVVLTAQWRDAESAQAVYTRLVADQPAEDVEGGTVQVDGTDVGQYLIVPHADGTGTAWWTNGTVLFQVDGPASALRDFYTAFPL